MYCSLQHCDVAYGIRNLFTCKCTVYEIYAELHNLVFHSFQRVLQMDAEEILHEFTYTDEAGFNLTKARRRGRHIGHGAIINVPGQRGGNITLCAAITQNGPSQHTSHSRADCRTSSQQ